MTLIDSKRKQKKHDIGHAVRFPPFSQQDNIKDEELTVFSNELKKKQLKEKGWGRYSGERHTFDTDQNYDVFKCTRFI